jgi:urease subunit gamma
MRERTLVMIGHEGVQRKHVGVLLGRLEARGLKIVDMRFLPGVPSTVAQDGAALSRCGLSRSAVGLPVLYAVVEGEGAVAAARKMLCADAPGSASSRLAIESPVAYSSATGADAAADLAVWLQAGAGVVRADQCMEGIAQMIHDVQVEATFPDGTKLVTVHHPIR